MRVAIRAIGVLLFLALTSCADAQEPAATPAPEHDFWTQETMTGDWGGTRSRRKEKGIDLEFKLERASLT